MKKICFFARVADRAALETVNFYKVNIIILKELGYSVILATKWSEIDWSCDILFIYWWTYAFFPVFLSRLFNKKTVIVGAFNFRCPNNDSDYFRRPWHERFLIRFSVKNADMNIFDSEKEKEQVQRYWKLDNCVYSPLVVQTDKYYYLNEIKRENNVLLSICWMQKTNMRRKCIFEMIDAVEILLNKGIDVVYYIAGKKGDGLESLIEYISAKGLNKNIFILGEIEEGEKIHLMRTCTIYLQISKYEAFGLAIAEAMACGATVLTSDVGEVSNVVGDAALICDSCLPSRVAAEIERLLNDKEKRIYLSNLAALRIKKNFQYSRRLNDLKNYLEVLLNK
jgi:glycosyltransferase involved in cell wall biosynthesis